MVRIVTDAQLSEWLNLAQTTVDYDYSGFMANHSDWTPELIFDNITKRNKFARIWAVNHSGSRSAWGFINLENGDVLKADGWKAPALNFARGNIYSADHGLSRVKWTGVS